MQLRLRYVLSSLLLMGLFYAALYQPYAADSVPGQALWFYLRETAEASAWVLRALGERVAVSDTEVLGRFSYVVVLDCAALDAQALFAAAVLAFPTRFGLKMVGLIFGLLTISALNVARLVVLFYAGVHSHELFQVLHEEVLVFVIVACVCLIFVGWMRWALQRDAARTEQVHAV